MYGYETTVREFGQDTFARNVRMLIAEGNLSVLIACVVAGLRSEHSRRSAVACGTVTRELAESSPSQLTKDKIRRVC